MANTPQLPLRGIEGGRSHPAGTGGSMDGWGTEDPSYSEREFYTASTDNKGHRSKIQLPMPPTVAAAINEIVAMRKVPAYRSVQDFVRDAIIHRLHRLVELGYIDSEETVRVLDQEIWHSQILASENQTTLNDQLVKDLERSLNLSLRLDDVREVRRMLRVAGERMDGMNEPWKSRTREIVERFRNKLDEETGRSHDGKET